MTDQAAVTALFADWQAACRADDVLRSLPVPDAETLVRAVAERLLGQGGSPDAVLRGLAAGLAAGDWHASGEVLQLQIGLLMQVMATNGETDHRRAAHVHTILAAAAAGVAVEAWRDKAEQDDLTGLRNRAGWERDITIIKAAGVHIAYASIDLDGLKAINDGPGGHAAGDETLRSFGRRLEIAVAGAGGSTYRYGGDEFSAVLRVDSGALSSILDELAGTQGVAAFSHGVASWPEDDLDLNSVVSTADRRMYDHKRARKAGEGQ